MRNETDYYLLCRSENQSTAKFPVNNTVGLKIFKRATCNLLYIESRRALPRRARDRTFRNRKLLRLPRSTYPPPRYSRVKTLRKLRLKKRKRQKEGVEEGVRDCLICREYRRSPPSLPAGIRITRTKYCLSSWISLTDAWESGRETSRLSN